MKHTPLYQAHVDAGGKMVDFGGWEMPLNYGSQIEEHHQVRNDVGMFDVSHMTTVDFKGVEAKKFLQTLIANDVYKLKTQGKALYSCMLNEAGGVVDDLIVYYQDDENYRMVINAGTTEKDIAWINAQAEGFDVSVEPKLDLAMIAVQGPNARAKVYEAIPGVEDVAGELKPFNSASLGGLFIARTGYTGEDGFEIRNSVAFPSRQNRPFFHQHQRVLGIKVCASFFFLNIFRDKNYCDNDEYKSQSHGAK